jgi:hypothetical protein
MPLQEVETVIATPVRGSANLPMKGKSPILTDVPKSVTGWEIQQSLLSQLN